MENNAAATVAIGVGVFTRVEVGCRGCPNKINMHTPGLGGVAVSRVLGNQVPHIIEEAVYTSSGLLGGSRNPVDERAGISECVNTCTYPIHEAAKAAFDALKQLGLNPVASEGEGRPLF